MNKLYRFSPIHTEKELYIALNYLTVELEKLSASFFSEKLPVTVLKIFAHHPEEYQFLYSYFKAKGKPAIFNTDKNFYVKVSEELHGNHITYMGVRIPDPYRMQVGCGDYEVSDFDNFRSKYINSNQFIRDAKDATKMLEIWNPDSDVLGYVIPKMV